jgi:hypothetical protein
LLPAVRRSIDSPDAASSEPSACPSWLIFRTPRVFDGPLRYMAESSGLLDVTLRATPEPEVAACAIVAACSPVEVVRANSARMVESAVRLRARRSSSVRS